MFYKKDKHGERTLDKKQVAKAALNIGKVVADSQRTTPAKNDPGLVPMERDKKPQAESDKAIRGQQPTDNGGDQPYVNGQLGPKKPRANNGSHFTKEDRNQYGR